MEVNSLAGKPAEPLMLVNVPKPDMEEAQTISMKMLWLRHSGEGLRAIQM